jgi:hypothetical protein
MIFPLLQELRDRGALIADGLPDESIITYLNWQGERRKKTDRFSIVNPLLPSEMAGRAGLMKTGTGSTTACITNQAEPLSVVVPVPVFIPPFMRSLSTSAQ